MQRSVRSARDPRNHLLWGALADAGRAQAPALLGGSRRLTYADVVAAVGRGAAELDDRFPPGSRLLVAAYDQMVVAIAFLASLSSRCVPLLVDPQPAESLARIACRWRVSGVMGDRGRLETVGETIDCETILGWTAGAASVPRELPAVRADEPAFWTFTSGTTGTQRAVVHAHRGPVAAYEAFGKRIVSFVSGDRTVSTAGLPFVYALGNNLVFPLLAGAAAILPSDLNLPTVLSEMEHHEATVLVSGPWSLEAMARLADRAGWGSSLRRLRLVLSAGEPLAEPVFERWRSTFGQAPLDNLGCTEMFNSFLAPSPGEARPGSLGRVVPGFEVRVGRAPAAPLRRGALSVRGRSRAVGVSGDAGGDRIDPPSGEWCETGDEVEVDAEGRFIYLGRLDDRFKVRGQFVRPAEVERRLLRVPGVSECMVAADTDERGLACVNVQVVLDPETLAGDDVLRRLRGELRQAIPAAARALRVEHVAGLPRNARGKVTRKRRATPSSPEIDASRARADHGAVAGTAAAESLFARFEELRREAPDALAVLEVAERRILSRDDLSALVDAVAARVRAGASPDGIVAVQTANGAGFVAAVLAAWREGAIPLLVDRERSRADVDALADALAFETVLQGPDLEPRRLRAGTTRPFVPPGTAVLKLTSGSTGEPRAVAVTERALRAGISQICTTMGIAAGDRNLATSPLAHSYAFDNVLGPLVTLGTPAVLASDLVPRRLLGVIREAGVTVWPAVPLLLDVLARAPATEASTGSLRLVISAGAPLPKPTREAFATRFRLRPRTFYGATECGGICFDREGTEGVPDGCVGRPLDGVAVELVDVSDGVGRVRVRSASVASATLPLPSEDLDDGTFLVSDVGFLDGAGRLHLVGRVGAFVKIHGHKVYPFEVERVIRSIPGVHDAAVVPFARSRVSEGLRAVVAAGAGVDRAAIVRACERALPAHKVPRSIEVRESLPRNERGKIDYRRL